MNNPTPAQAPPRVAYTLPQVAALLGKTVRAVRRHAQNGELPFEKIGQHWFMRAEVLHELFGEIKPGIPAPRAPE